MGGQRLDHRNDGRVLQERQLACSEVVEQRPERFGAKRYLRVEFPPRIEIQSRHGQYTPHMPSMETSSTRDSSTRSFSSALLSRSDMDSSCGRSEEHTSELQ